MDGRSVSHEGGRGDPFFRHEIPDGLVDIMTLSGIIGIDYDGKHLYTIPYHPRNGGWHHARTANRRF